MFFHKVFCLLVVLGDFFFFFLIYLKIMAYNHVCRLEQRTLVSLFLIFFFQFIYSFQKTTTEIYPVPKWAHKSLQLFIPKPARIQKTNEVYTFPGIPKFVYVIY